MRLVRFLVIGLVSLVLAACGGGGTLENENNGGGSGSTPVYTLVLSLKDSQGATSNQLALASPLILEAKLTATHSGVVAGRLISFSVNNTNLASFENDTGSAVTDSQGLAKIAIRVGELSGAGIITATYDESAANIAFVSAGDGDVDTGVSIGSISLIADKLQLGSANTDAIELSALVRNTNNNVVPDIPVTFTADSGELQILDSHSAENGIVRATLTSRSNKNNREIKVTARAQQYSSELTLTVVGTKINISAPLAVVLNDTVTIDAFVQDSEGNGIEGVTLNITSALNNTLNITNPTTVGSDGKASFTYTAVHSGVDTITISGLGSQRNLSLNVGSDEFSFITNSTEPSDIEEVKLNTAHPLELQWLVDGIPKVSESVNFATSRGVIAEAEGKLADNKVALEISTDVSGIAEVFVSSQFAGLTTIEAKAEGREGIISTQKQVEFISDKPTKIEVQAFPAQIGPGEQSTIRAILRDNNNNPVKNKTIVFTIDESAGGTLNSVSVDTDSRGVATTIFTADDDSDVITKVKIKASVDGSSETISGDSDIAIGKRTLFFRLGTGNNIEKPSNTLYSKEFSVIVTDGSGNPVPDHKLNISVVSDSYDKGHWEELLSSQGTFKSWVAKYSREESCPNEDVNLNGILEDSEDTNGDDQITPGNLASVPLSVVTDSAGIANFDVTYPQDVGGWLNVRLQVSGIAAGTENVAYRIYRLPVAAEDTQNEMVAPPRNPFGQSAICEDID